PKTTSRLLSLKAAGNSLATENLMAFWLAPEEKSGEMPAKNKTRLSAHGLRKRVTIGLPGLPHAIEYKVTFAVPAGEGHRRGVFEAVTGYMPAEFSKFWKFDPNSAKFEPLDDGPGEQSLPVALATPDGKFAMGVYSPAQPSRGFESAGYGRFRFPAEKVVKWNCVFREENPRGLAAKDYEYLCYVAVGTLEDVRRTLEALSKRPAKRKNEER
ncbi:MAG TPA: hypothetical protein VNC50_13835, partial [Planctomycetia bacterium]|nr:hypothetical protein [Planctomycetia bacterium]